MDRCVQARLNYVRDVINGNYTRAQAEAELDRMEREYGKDAFLSGTFERKPRPWTRKDLEDMELWFASGMGSRDFLSYLAEVSEEVHRKERRNRRLRTAGILGGAAAILAIIILMVRMLKT